MSDSDRKWTDMVADEQFTPTEQPSAPVEQTQKPQETQYYKEKYGESDFVLMFWNPSQALEQWMIKELLEGIDVKARGIRVGKTGKCYADFENVEEMERVKELDGNTVGDIVITVSIVPPRDDSQKNSFNKGRSHDRKEGGRSYDRKEGGRQYDRKEGGKQYDRKDGGRQYDRKEGGRQYDRREGGRQYERKEGGRQYDRKDGGRSYDRKESGRPFERKDDVKPFERKDDVKPFERKDDVKPFDRRDDKRQFERKDTGKTYGDGEKKDQHKMNYNSKPYGKTSYGDRKDRRQQPQRGQKGYGYNKPQMTDDNDWDSLNFAPVVHEVQTKPPTQKKEEKRKEDKVKSDENSEDEWQTVDKAGKSKKKGPGHH